jgi:hypothetical protein
MKTSLVWCFVAALAVLAGGHGVAGAAETMAGPSPEQQAAPQEQAAPEQSATTQQQVAPNQQVAAEKLGLPATITKPRWYAVGADPGGGVHDGQQ